jgi:hypothetical protein
MKTLNVKNILIPILFSFIWLVPSFAADTSHNHNASTDHSGHEQHGTDANKGATDKYFHQTHIDGYHFSYELIDMREKLKNQKIQVTHHLMLIIAKDGSAVEPQKAGFLITAPDGTKQQAMAMTMGGGAGANIDLSQKGEYAIKVKAVVEGENLIDSLTYIVE